MIMQSIAFLQDLMVVKFDFIVFALANSEIKIWVRSLQRRHWRPYVLLRLVSSGQVCYNHTWCGRATISTRVHVLQPALFPGVFGWGLVGPFGCYKLSVG